MQKKKIGSYIGEYVDSFGGSPNWSLRKHILRVQVKICIAERIPTRFYLDRSGMNRLWIPFKYERLADFCYSCGLLDHTENLCKVDLPPVNG